MAPGEHSGRSATVVVVTYNNAADITDCLRSLLTTTVTTRLHVVVVDNASKDETVDLARRIADDDDRVAIIVNTANAGFGAACNQGAAAGDDQFVVLLNPDTVVHDGAVDALVAVADRPGIGPVAGRTVDSTGRIDPLSAQNVPSLRDTVWWALAIPVWGRRLPGWLGRALGRNPVLLSPDELAAERPVGVVIGCLLALRRSDWTALRGFDESYFMYGEDVDLSLRARAVGLIPTYTPDAVITHYVGRSSHTFGAKLIVAMSGRVTVMVRHWKPGRARLGQALLVAGTALRALGEIRSPTRPWTETLAARDRWRHGYPRRQMGQTKGSDA
jgi:GT2 family glycosyltransferase